MSKYKVIGEVSVRVEIAVEAENADAAYEQAESELSELTAYCGNGGSDKLIGVAHADASVESSDNIDWHDIELVE